MEYKDPYSIPTLLASEQSLKGMGNIVYNFDEEIVKKRPWPVEGWRTYCPGTDIIPGEAVSQLYYKWDVNGCTAKKDIGRQTTIGYLATERYPKKNSNEGEFKMADIGNVLFREMTYHPDCGEVFYPKDGAPFVAVLAQPGDDFNPAKVRAYYFDGTFGLQCDPRVWHQGMFPLVEECVFRGKQGPLHACVTIDTVEEFGQYMMVSLEKQSK